MSPAAGGPAVSAPPGGNPPDAVRVWRGYGNPEMSLQEFLERLGTVFVPTTVLMQIDAGLEGYLPAVLGGLPDKPAGVPDEAALVLWEAQQTYTDGFQTLGVRSYSLTHNAVYVPPSAAQFPLAFAGELQSEQPYHLFAGPADWMRGEAVHLAGARPAQLAPADFRTQAAAALTRIQSAGELAGAIVCAGEDYLVYWALGAPGSPAPGASARELAALCGWQQTVELQPTPMEFGLWQRWPGIETASGQGFNMQFRRRREKQ